MKKLSSKKIFAKSFGFGFREVVFELWKGGESSEGFGDVGVSGLNGFKLVELYVFC